MKNLIEKNVQHKINKTVSTFLYNNIHNQSQK